MSTALDFSPPFAKESELSADSGNGRPDLHRTYDDIHKYLWLAGPPEPEGYRPLHLYRILHPCEYPELHMVLIKGRKTTELLMQPLPRYITNFEGFTK